MFSRAARLAEEVGEEEATLNLSSEQHAVQSKTDEASTDASSKDVVAQEINTTRGHQRFFNAICDASAGCETASGGRYKSPQSCALHGGARGCAWVPELNCCGRVDLGCYVLM